MKKLVLCILVFTLFALGSVQTEQGGLLPRFVENDWDVSNGARRMRCGEPSYPGLLFSARHEITVPVVKVSWTSELPNREIRVGPAAETLRPADGLTNTQITEIAAQLESEWKRNNAVGIYAASDIDCFVV